MAIRRGTPSDIPLLRGITRAAFAESATYPYPSSALSETWEEVAKAIRLGVLLRFQDGRAVGALRYHVDEGRLYFTRLCVLPAARHEGHAGALLSAVELVAREADCNRIECSARSRYPDTRSFYTQRGYVVVGYEDVYGVKGLRTNLRRVLHGDGT